MRIKVYNEKNKYIGIVNPYYYERMTISELLLKYNLWGYKIRLCE